MKKLLWSAVAEQSLILLAPSDAERVIDGMTELAETGRGFVRTMLETSEQRLYIPGHAITFHVANDAIYVLRVMRSGRRR